jgi:hypothetical protein
MATSDDNPHNEVGRVSSLAKKFERLIEDSGMHKHVGIHSGKYQRSTATNQETESSSMQLGFQCAFFIFTGNREI